MLQSHEGKIWETLTECLAIVSAHLLTALPPFNRLAAHQNILRQWSKTLRYFCSCLLNCFPGSEPLTSLLLISLFEPGRKFSHSHIFSSKEAISVSKTLSSVFGQSVFWMPFWGLGNTPPADTPWDKAISSIDAVNTNTLSQSFLRLPCCSTKHLRPGLEMWTGTPQNKGHLVLWKWGQQCPAFTPSGINAVAG